MSTTSPTDAAPAVAAGRAAPEGRPVRVAFDRAVAPSATEASYVMRTVLRTAGYAVELGWADGAAAVDAPDIYYGPPRPDIEAAIRIPMAPWPLRSAPDRDAAGVHDEHGVPVLEFAGEPRARWGAAGDGGADGAPAIAFSTDVIFGAYWLLTGAREPTYPRDRWDNLSLDESVIVRDRLTERPPVSLLAARLRALFERRGVPALRPPWVDGEARAAFAFSHDVDYPEIIRWIEVPRVLLSRGPRGVPSAWGVARGTNHFWTFREWVDFGRAYGARPCFYFMARQGSLLQYALGTPDDFYDIRTPRFAALFAELRDAGCEIGLHASFRSHRSVAQLRHERETVERAAGVSGIGNRHHFWHLDPADPNETLRRHELAGLAYDSSLGLEFYPGFRRGICHPFRVFHPGERRELDIVQLPPAWMDDHFDRRLARNGIADPDAVASTLLDAARATGGIAIVDYHSRGMNSDFYPRYGPWLRRFAERHFDRTLRFLTPGELADGYRRYERQLDARSVDRTGATGAPGAGRAR